MSSQDHTTTPLPADGTLQIVILGGGITGLSTAYYLQRLARAAGINVQTTLVEREAQLGGKIKTSRDGAGGEFMVEAGPDSFLVQKPWAADLVRDLGLGADLLPLKEDRGPTFVLVDGRPRPMPDGMMLIVPTKLLPFLRTPLFTPLGKLRMALDLIIPPRRDGRDETLAAFIYRRLGAEALDRLGEPLLAGIHSAEPRRQSLLATFPSLRALEEQHRSLIRGMRAARLAQRAKQGAVRQPPSSPFLTLRHGLGEMVEAIARSLAANMLTGHGAVSIESYRDCRPRYTVQLSNGECLRADAVVLAVPAFEAAAMLERSQPTLATLLRRIRYVSTATVSLAYRAGEFGNPLPGYGMVIPRSERRKINAVTITSSKFDGRAPANHRLLRVFLGGSRHPDLPAQDDETILRVAREELRLIFGIRATPSFTRIYRWPLGNPQYDLRHLERVAAMEQLCPPGLFLTGSAYRGVGIPDCVHQGQQAAIHTLAFLQGTLA